MADDQKTCSQELVLTYQRVHALRSRYAVAKKLGVTPGSVYRWMNGKGQMDETTALQIALDLGKDPMQVMSRLRLERPHTEREAQIWGRFRGRIFLAAIVALTVGQIVEAPHMGNGDQMRQAIHYAQYEVGNPPLDATYRRGLLGHRTAAGQRQFTQRCTGRTRCNAAPMRTSLIPRPPSTFTASRLGRSAKQNSERAGSW